MINDIVLHAILTLCSIGLLSAVMLYFVARKFKVDEDHRIDKVESMLPGANCGGCGFPSCRGMATALVGRDDISKLFCPPGGNDTMSRIAAYLGKTVPQAEPMLAIVRCGGSYAKRTHTNTYDGASSCAISAALYGGETGCPYGCIGKGDCVAACKFDAIHMNLDTGLPEVVEEKCVACGACVTACPKTIIELRVKGIKHRRVFVNCINKDKGSIAKRACEVACIGCGKCVKVCAFGAITMTSNLAYIDFVQCTLCRKCVGECPTGAIIEVNFPKAKNPAMADMATNRNSEQ